MSFLLFVHPFIPLSIHSFVHPSIICVSFYPSMSLFVCLSISLSVYLSVSLSVGVQHVRQFVPLSITLFETS